MAKQNGLVKIEGTIEDLTFYTQNGKNFVRRKGGISKERIENDPNFIRTRENNSEFSTAAGAGKILRLSLGSLIFKAKDSKMVSRLVKTMSDVKRYDTNSARGQRQVYNGLSTPDGKMMLSGFDFNINAPLNSVLFATYDLDTVSGEVKIANLVPQELIRYPEGSTHVSFQSAVLAVDFDTEQSELVLSNLVNIPLDLTPTSITLTPTSVPATTGVTLFLLSLSFFQEFNGVQYSLKNEEYSVLQIVAVV